MRASRVAVLLVLPISLIAGSISTPTTTSNTQTLSFEPSGVIQLERSFGNVEIEGWDRPEVQITTIRTTTAAENDTDALDVTTVKQGEDHLRITTSQRNKTKSELKYVIKAPAQVKLVVHHEIGEVSVANFIGDIEVTNRVGDIGLRLSQPESYKVDAKAKVGAVLSEVGESQPLPQAGQLLRSDFSPCGSRVRKQLYLRVGVGDIRIRKLTF